MVKVLRLIPDIILLRIIYVKPALARIPVKPPAAAVVVKLMAPLVVVEPIILGDSVPQLIFPFANVPLTTGPYKSLHDIPSIKRLTKTPVFSAQNTPLPAADAVLLSIVNPFNINA